MYKLILDNDNRIVGHTKDPLFTDYQAMPESLPDLTEGKPLGDYLYIDNEFIYSPVASGSNLTEIVITSITGALKTNSTFTWVTAVEGTDVRVEFQIDKGEDRMFALTLKGQGNTPEAKFFAQVDKTGKGIVILNFGSMGDYVFSSEEANKNLPDPRYFTKDVLIEVGRVPSEPLESLK